MVLMEYGDEALVRVSHERQFGLVVLGLSVIQKPQQISGGLDVRLTMLFDAIALEQHPHHRLLQLRNCLRVKVSVLADQISQHREFNNQKLNVNRNMDSNLFSRTRNDRCPMAT